MEVYALIGRSGTGKSHRAQHISKKYGIGYILDDGLFINGNRVIAGTSAKRESTRIAAVRRAIFVNPAHREEIMEAIKAYGPESILILGTSDNMIDKIAKNLDIPAATKRIYIEDIASREDIELATRMRKEQGKHVIPVPTFAVKKHFSGYFIDSIKNLVRRGKGPEVEVLERTVVRPTFSYLGKYTISNSVIRDMIAFAGSSVEGIHKVQKVAVENTEVGLKINVDIAVKYGCIIHETAVNMREHIKKEMEYMTGFNILEINVCVKDLII